MIQLVRNGAQMTREESQIVIKNYIREAKFFVDNAIMDSKTAPRFAFAIECLGLHRLTQFKEEIISVCCSVFMEQHAEAENKFTTKETLGTARFIAELLFQGLMEKSTGEGLITLVPKVKTPSGLTKGCLNLLRFAVMSKIMHEESKTCMSDGKNFKL